LSTGTGTGAMDSGGNSGDWLIGVEAVPAGCGYSRAFY